MHSRDNAFVTVCQEGQFILSVTDIFYFLKIKKKKSRDLQIFRLGSTFTYYFFYFFKMRKERMILVQLFIPLSFVEPCYLIYKIYKVCSLSGFCSVTRFLWKIIVLGFCFYILIAMHFRSSDNSFENLYCVLIFSLS